MKNVIYLAGPMLGLTYEECTGWRNEVIYAFNNEIEDGVVAILDPSRGLDFLIGKGKLLGSYENHLMGKEKHFFHRDVSDVRNSTIILANFLGSERKSSGTIAELGMAYALNKSIVSIVEPNSVHDHPFIRQMSGFLCTNLSDGIVAAKSLCG